MSLDEFLRRKIMKEEKPEKQIPNPGVIGHYDSKPYHNFRYALIYANDVKVIDTEDVELFSRVYKGVTFVIVLVNEEKDFELDKFKYDAIKPKLMEAGVPATDKVCEVIVFQHYTQKSVDLCRLFCNSTKTHFEQGLIYNPKYVQCDFYRPVPKFYARMYDIFCEVLYFDLAFIDSDRE